MVEIVTVTRVMKYYVPQLDRAGLDPWTTPKLYNNWYDYFQTGYSETDNVGSYPGNRKRKLCYWD